MPAQVLYLGKQGKQGFCYKRTKYQFHDGVDEWSKIEPTEAGAFEQVADIDFGDSTEDTKEFWDHVLTDSQIKRDDPLLVEVVEELGAKANTPYSALTITEVPDGIDWVIDEYDGYESVEESHRSW